MVNHVDSDTRITGERVKAILDNPDLTSETLSERTGLSVKLVALIRKVESRGLRKHNPDGR